MNWLDFVLLILVLGSAVSAFSKGFTRELVGFVTVIAALVLSSWFYGSAGGYLLPYVSSPTVAHLVGFLFVFGAVLLLGGLAGRVLRGVMKVAGMSFLDRLLGAAFGFARGMLIAIALVMAIMAFAPGKRAPRAVVNSRLAPYVIDAARVASAIAPHELKAGFRTSYDEIRSTWDSALKKGIRKVPSGEKDPME